MKLNSKILITGGAGFIGSALIRFLVHNTEHTVINVDKLTYAGNLNSLKSVHKNQRYFFEKADICDSKKLEHIFSHYQPDAVMHLAAESHVDRSIIGPSDFIQTNIVGTFTLLEQTRAYWNSLKARVKDEFRFHHISTDEVFGDLPIFDNDQKTLSSKLFTEKTPYEPSSPYSASKAGSDHLVRAWHRTYGLPVLITNCSNNYGPFHFPEKLIPLMILNAIERKPLPVYGSGNQIRDWLYVDDHVKGLLKVITKGQVGETYNIGGSNEKKNIEVVKLICSLLDEIQPIDISYASLIKHVPDRPGHDLRYAIDSSKIQNDLGWKPEENFETGIKKTILWYLDNLDWCKKIQDGRYMKEAE